jgi:putative transposase
LTKALVKSELIKKDILRIQIYVTRPQLVDLLSEERLSNKQSRDEIVVQPYGHYGYTLKEMYGRLNVHYTTISRIIKRIEKKRYCKHG